MKFFKEVKSYLRNLLHFNFHLVSAAMLFIDMTMFKSKTKDNISVCCNFKWNAISLFVTRDHFLKM